MRMPLFGTTCIVPATQAHLRDDDRGIPPHVYLKIELWSPGCLRIPMINHGTACMELLIWPRWETPSLIRLYPADFYITLHHSLTTSLHQPPAQPDTKTFLGLKALLHIWQRGFAYKENSWWNSNRSPFYLKVRREDRCLQTEKFDLDAVGLSVLQTSLTSFHYIFPQDQYTSVFSVRIKVSVCPNGHWRKMEI